MVSVATEYPGRTGRLWGIDETYVYETGRVYCTYQAQSVSRFPGMGEPDTEMEYFGVYIISMVPNLFPNALHLCGSPRRSARLTGSPPLFRPARDITETSCCFFGTRPSYSL